MRKKKSSLRILYLHMTEPRTHVSGRALTSTIAVGTHVMRISRSAKLKFIKNMLVDVLISLLGQTTSGTRRFPQMPTMRDRAQRTLTVTLRHMGKLIKAVADDVSLEPLWFDIAEFRNNIEELLVTVWLKTN